MGKGMWWGGVRCAVLLAGLMALSAAGVLGQEVGGAAEDRATRSPAALRSLSAVRIVGQAPAIDGRLNDVAWRSASVASGFVQFEPSEGLPASHESEVRVLYDDDAIYVAFRAFDSNPELISALRTRRDVGSASDRVHVVIDSYHDRRTAFHFGVNPAGVKMDVYRFDDSSEDSGWDAVWDVATQIDSLGWTAEFRIPLSQLRFSGSDRQDWGINFARDIARLNETSVWSPLSRQDRAMVSRSGILEGLENLEPKARIEVLPYTVGRVTRAPGNPANPFYESNATAFEVGGDLRYGVTNNLTLDLTVNPDFGQVEADPSQVNLTAFETFFPERRPFFQEGASIFNYGLGVGDGDGANQSLFYSRRIGRAPQGSTGGGADWVDRPSQTRILGAGKLSGKTESGWSIGVLSALTGSAHADVSRGGVIEALEIEPTTNYSMVRLQRDFRGGSSAIGVIGTATNRDGEVADALGLGRDAFTGGVDFRHRFRNNTLEIGGQLLGSRVAGSAASILRTQLSSARYYQRPDADHLTLDPDATSLSGYAGKLELWKVGGGPWRFAVATMVRSPGFEVNDLGFLPQVDNVEQVGFLGYQSTQPGAHLRRWNVNLNSWSAWSFGGEHQNIGGNVNGSLTTLGNFSAHGGLNFNRGGLNTRSLRGGPALQTDPNYNTWFGVNTDGRRALQFSWNTQASIRPDDDSWSVSVSPALRWLPNEWATLRIGPSYSRRVEATQWVGRVDLADGAHYLMGRMDQSTVGMSLRADLAITPTLSVQFYGQPFVSAGSFGDFLQVEDPRASRYDDRFAAVPAERQGNGYRADLNGDGVMNAFGNPDFNVGQFRSNAVLRWEYRPGSTVFLVWAQGRDQFSQDPEFQVGTGLDTLFSQAPENVFMIKMNYWLNP